jgi:hypothetical protein
MYIISLSKSVFTASSSSSFSSNIGSSPFDTAIRDLRSSIDGTSGVSGEGRDEGSREDRWVNTALRVEGRSDVVWSGKGRTARRGSWHYD